MFELFPMGVQIRAIVSDDYSRILTPEALQFLANLHRQFNPRRIELLQARSRRQAELDDGALPAFLDETAAIRANPDWRVAATPPDLQKRRVEITGPTDRKMLINALNSGASVFMADFEDANTPTWDNLLNGQLNLIDAIERTITFTNPDGKMYRLNEQTAVLMVRPRGWHLPEKHLLVDGEEISGSLFDFGLYFFHNAHRLISKGSGPYFYLPKLESYLEARLWNDVFLYAQQELGLPAGTIRATVLIETILAAFEMEEILYELREHAAGLNAGRWDYIFSAIKKFHRRTDFLLPDRAQIAMTTPFMRAYTELLVKTCHKRGAHAMGGMAAFIPNRRNPEINDLALAKVREDKLREVNDGFDGTWVAHPDLVAVAMEEFDCVLGERPHQKERLRPEVEADGAALVNFAIPGGVVSENGLRHNISVGLQYLESWLRGTAAVGIYNLMEDVATAEISRAQVWHWLHHPQACLQDGRRITPEMYHALVEEELAKISTAAGQPASGGNYDMARQIFDHLVLDDHFSNFLTLVAYPFLD